MPLFNKVAIVGTGLIGGSLALALRKKKLAGEIIGVSRRKKTLELARKKRIIDRGSQDLRIIVGADLVILATPVDIILELARPISRLIGKDCIVSDVGSVKKDIVAKLDKLFPNYVGAHPLAGSEKRGVVHASPDIFKNSVCILTPTRNTDKQALTKIKNLWHSLGSETMDLSCDEHDRALSFVSHLPHVVAFSLIASVPQGHFRFASGGLRDTTRIAASDSEIWNDIFLRNRRNILKAVSAFERNLTLLKSALKKRDKHGLDKLLRLAKRKRETLG